MRTQRLCVYLGIGVALVLGISAGGAAEKRSDSKGALHLTVHQKELVSREPILVTLRVDSAGISGLPASPGKSAQGTLRFEIEPAVQSRKGAKPLPLEGIPDGPHAQTRNFDLLEWFAFPDKGGTWTVKAALEHKGKTLTTQAFSITIRKAAKGDAEFAPMDRIHHIPWSNYDTNAFCGDTFDLVKRWPDSRFAKYCHYWNGRYLQNKKDYEKAIASYRIVVDKYPNFPLADDAAYGIVECLRAQGKLTEAQKSSTQLRRLLDERAVKAGLKPGTGQTVVQRLAHGMVQRINRDLGVEK